MDEAEEASKALCDDGLGLLFLRVLRAACRSCLFWSPATDKMRPNSFRASYRLTRPQARQAVSVTVRGEVWESRCWGRPGEAVWRKPEYKGSAG